MSASTILDVAIGISFVFMLLSVMASAVTEAISGVFSLRAVTLRQGIQRLLNDQTLTDKVYANPLVDGLTQDDDSDPAYIPSDLFARALVAAIVNWDDAKDQAVPPKRLGFVKTIVVIPGRAIKSFFRRLWPNTAKGEQEPQKTATNLEEVKKRLASAKGFDEHARTALSALLNDANVKTLDDAQLAIAAWFDRSMESVSGWYKRSSHMLISVVALVISVVLNVDTFVLLDSLHTDSALRESVAAAVIESIKSETKVAKTAQEAVTEQKEAGKAKPEEVLQAEERKTGELVKDRIVAVKAGLDELTLPVGWPEGKPLVCRPAAGEVCDRRLLKLTLSGVLRRIGGWLFTTIAIALGAPFWFDVLNKLINLRAAAPPPSKVQPKTTPAGATAAPSTEVTREDPRTSRINGSRSDAPPPLS